MITTRAATCAVLLSLCACGADDVQLPPLPDAGEVEPGPDAQVPPGQPQIDAGMGEDPPARDGGGPSSGSDGSTPDGSSPPTSTGPGDWGPGDYPPNLRAQEYLELTGVPGQADKVRGYKVHVPPSYDPSVPMPVVFAFHASNMNAVMFAIDGAHFPEKADAEGFIAIMPNGLQEEIFGGTWNAGTCCGKASELDLDDIALVRAILAEVGTHLNLDLTRVYATGLSNGAELAHRLGCEASDIFAAIAPLAGGIMTPTLAPEPGNDQTTFTTCDPTHTVPVLAMHGTADTFVPYSGFDPTLDYWAMQNGCTTETMPALSPTSGGDTTCVTYVGCPDGVEVTGCTVDQGGHCWFGDPTCGTGAPLIGNIVVGKNSDTLKATDAAWAFMSRFVRTP